MRKIALTVPAAGTARTTRCRHWEPAGNELTHGAHVHAELIVVHATLE